MNVRLYLLEKHVLKCILLILPSVYTYRNIVGNTIPIVTTYYKGYRYQKSEASNDNSYTVIISNERDQ